MSSIDTIQRIRQLVERTGISLYRLSRDSGVGYATVYRVVRDGTDCYSASADAMLRALERQAEQLSDKQ